MNINLKLALFCILLFNFWIFYMFFLKFLKKQLLCRKQLTKIGVWQVILLISLSLFSTNFYFFILLGCVLPSLCLFSSQFIIKTFRKTQFKKQFLGFLKDLILKVHLGNSFRSAFQEISEQEEGLFRHKLDRLYKSVVFLQHLRGDPYLSKLCSELKSVDQSPDTGLNRLESLQKRLETEEKFRLKSSEILRHLRFQAFVLSLFYLALLVFVVHQFSWESYRLLISFSFVLFTLGLALLFSLGRRFQWIT